MYVFAMSLKLWKGEGAGAIVPISRVISSNMFHLFSFPTEPFIRFFW